MLYAIQPKLWAEYTEAGSEEGINKSDEIIKWANAVKAVSPH